MNRSDEQAKALQNGEAEPVTVEPTDDVRRHKDIEEQSQKFTEYDDSEFSEAELEALATETFQQLDHPEEIP